MQLVEGFNPLDHDPAQGAGSLPLGKYPVVITAAEVKPTKDNTGGLIEFQLEVIDGPHKGATGAYRLNIYNNSKDAVKIAQRQLSAICHVVGVFQLGADGKQLGALFGRPFVVNVIPQKNDDKYTEVQGVFDMAGNPPNKAGQAPQGQQATAGGFQQQQASPAQQTQQAAPQAGAQAWGAGQGQGQPAAGAQAAQGSGWGAGQAAPQQQQQAPAQGGWQQGGGQQAAAGGNAGPSWGPQR